MLYIGFGTNEKYLSQLIRWATNSPWSHVWLEYYSSFWGSRWAIHAGPTGIVLLPIDQVYSAYPLRYLYECRIDLSAGLKWAQSQLGVAYDYGVIWNILLLVIYQVTGWKWLYKITSRNTAKFTCSEFVTSLLQAAGVKEVSGLNPEYVSPGALQKLCASSGNFWVTRHDKKR